MREDIFGGLRNAIDKGDDLEKAVRSFISAGYPEAEVRQAAQALRSGIPDQMQMPMPKQPALKPMKQQPTQAIPQQPATMPHQKNSWPVQKNQSTLNQPGYSAKRAQAQVQPPQTIKPKGKTDWKLITLITILLVLMIGLFVSFFFKESITEFFANLFG